MLVHEHLEHGITKQLSLQPLRHALSVSCGIYELKIDSHKSLSVEMQIYVAIYMWFSSDIFIAIYMTFYPLHS